jgi:hypothetical protein
LDYNTREGHTLYRRATASLYAETGEPFDCEPDTLADFIQLIDDHSEENGLNRLFQIPDNRDPANRINRNFLDNYGVVTLGMVRDHASTYVNSHSRNAQNSVQLYHCLMNSLSLAGRSKITIWNADYIVAGQRSGVALLKVIIRESDLDTHATAAHIRMQLASLDEFIGTIDSDILKFNIHVKNLVDGLTKRRQTTSDLLTYLFKGYKAASDSPFVDYIKRKEEEHEDGKDLTTDELMNHAANKYKIRLKRRQWNAPSPKESKILALEAKVSSLEKKANTGPAKPKRAKSGPSDKRGDSDSKQGKPEWMTEAPNREDIEKVKMVDGKKYYWCQPLKCFCRHHPKDCNATKQSSSTASTSSSISTKKDTKGKLRFSNALAHVAEEDKDGEDGSESE